MGNIFSSCPCRRHRIGYEKEITLLMIGLDNAGKSCTAKHLLGESTSDVVPTVGFTSIQVKHGRFNVCIYDIGGGPKIRGIWKNYYALVHGVIFVVDANEAERFEECKKEIRNVIKDERIAGKPILLFFNKQDLDGAVNETELVNLLELEALVNEYRCPTRVEGSCAIFEEKTPKDPGIQDGFNWLIGHIGKEIINLQQRVDREKSEQMKKEEQERAERMERVRKLREEREKAEKLRLQEEGGNNPEPNGCADDDDDDVVVGNPFKPLSLIKTELQQKESRSGHPGIKVIHVSPTNSSGEQEEIILHPQAPYPSTMQSYRTEANHMTIDETKAFSFSPYHEVASKDKARSRKPKKRFKNRIVPHVSESVSLTQVTAGDLPPLKSAVEMLNGNIAIYSPPIRHPPLYNGEVNPVRENCSAKQSSESL